MPTEKKKGGVRNGRLGNYTHSESKRKRTFLWGESRGGALTGEPIEAALRAGLCLGGSFREKDHLEKRRDE